MKVCAGRLAGFVQIVSNKPFVGLNKMDSLSKFFDSIIDGTADLTVLNEEAKAEEFVPDATELEIEKQQEAQRIALAHGGFADLIDFEKAVKEGAGADYHDVHGYPGMMGDVPTKKADAAEEVKAEEHVKTAEPEQVVFEPKAGGCKRPAEDVDAEPSAACGSSDAEAAKEHPKDEL